MSPFWRLTLAITTLEHMSIKVNAREISISFSSECIKGSPRSMLYSAPCDKPLLLRLGILRIYCAYKGRNLCLYPATTLSWAKRMSLPFQQNFEFLLHIGRSSMHIELLAPQHDKIIHGATYSLNIMYQVSKHTIKHSLKII